MNLIISSDLSHDPDDFFAICYLISAGINIRAIDICPGNSDQIGFARFLCREVGLDIPIGASKLNRDKRSSGSIHHELLRKYKYPLDSKPDGLGADIIKEVFDEYPDSEFFVIGPATSIGKFIRENNPSITRLTMQGGFLSYSSHIFPCKRLEKFEGIQSVETFNMNGDKEAVKTILSANINERLFVGKHLCHTIEYTRDNFAQMDIPKDRASELFVEGMLMYLERHDKKLYHDPVCATLMLHPEIGTWINGTPYYGGGKWGTAVDNSNNKVIVDVNRNNLWEHIYSYD